MIKKAALQSYGGSCLFIQRLDDHRVNVTMTQRNLNVHSHTSERPMQLLPDGVDTVGSQ